MTKNVSCWHIGRREATDFPIEKLDFRPSVYGVITKGTKVLLIKNKMGKYELPGGGIDKGESIFSALLREVHEETGLSVTVTDERPLLIDSDYFYDNYADKAYQTILMFYHCGNPEGGISTDGHADAYERENLSTPVWIAVEEARNYEYMLPTSMKKVFENL